MKSTFRHIKFILILLTSLTGVKANAQSNWITDSLKTALSIADADTMRARIANEIALEYYGLSLDSSMRYGILCGEFAEKAGDLVMMAQSQNTQGVCFLNQSSLMNALDHFQMAYELYKRAGDRRGEAKMLNNLGVIYTSTQDYRRAVEKYEASRKLNLELGISEAASNAIYNLSLSHFLLEDYPKAWEYANELKAFHASHPGSIGPWPLYGDLFERENRLDSARFYMEKSLFEQKLHGDLYNWSLSVVNLSRVVMKQGEPTAALEILEQASDIIHENGMIDAEYSYLVTKSEIYNAMGLHKEAYDFQKKAIAMDDSIDHMNQMNMINDMNTKYETDRMESEISAQQSIIENKQVWLASSMVVGVLLIIGLAGAFYMLKRNRRLNSLLKLQNSQISTQRQKIISSINYAKRIQQSTLPKEQDFRKLFRDSFIYFKPKDIISGDFYAYQQIGNRIYVAAVDCTGHGVPGAFMSLIANAKLNKVVNEMGERDPGRILTALHREIQSALHQEGHDGQSMDGMEMSLCAIDKFKRTIEFAGAGSSIFIARKGEMTEYKGHIAGIGGMDYTWQNGHAHHYTTQKIEFEENDVLYLFSDGIHDQIGGAEMKKLNKSRFREHLRSLSSAALDNAVQRCEKFVSDWRMNAQQTDDIMLIGIRL